MYNGNILFSGKRRAMTKGESEITDEGNKPEGNTDQDGAQLDIQIDVIDIE